MTDDDEGPLVIGQIILQPGNAVDVQVVGRLVQYQQFRLFQQHLGQGQTGVLPARKLLDLHVPHGLVKLKAIENGLDVRFVAETTRDSKVFGQTVIISQKLIKSRPHQVSHLLFHGSEFSFCGP